MLKGHVWTCQAGLGWEAEVVYYLESRGLHGVVRPRSSGIRAQQQLWTARVVAEMLDTALGRRRRVESTDAVNTILIQGLPTPQRAASSGRPFLHGSPGR